MASVASQVKMANASILGIFSLYLIARGISPFIVAISGISALKYIYLSGSESPDRQKAHYLSWFLTTPIMLWLIFSLNHLSLGTTTLMILLNQLMIAAGYFAAVDLDKGDRESMWRWFWLGCFAFLPIVYQLLMFSEGLALIVLTLITWSTYPIVWWADAEKLISTDTRDVSYSFLDLTSKVGIVALYLWELKAL
jgi:bacteriorhodopsin